MRGSQQLTRVCNRRCSDFLAAEHARDLVDALFVRIETPDAGPRLSLHIFFPDVEVRRAEAGDLGKMRDADDLIGGRELAEFPADDFGHATADAGIDLVEDECRRRATE